MSPRNWIPFVWAGFVFLFLATTLVPYSAALQEASTYFSLEEIRRTQRYSFERRGLYWLSVFVELAWLSFLVLNGRARTWTDTIHARTGKRWIVTLIVVAGVYWLGHELCQFPIALARLAHSRAWEMTHRPTMDWLGEYVLALGVRGVTQAPLLVGFYVLLRRFPANFWVVGSFAGIAVAVLYATLLPTVIEPLFNTFTPIRETRWHALEPRFRTLVEKANVHVDEVLVVDRSRQGNHTNAYFTGFGSTRRIVLYDTLLKSHTPEEIESILGHELGHWRHDHIVQGIAMGGFASLGGLLILAWLLDAMVGKPGLRLKSPSDPAGLPVIVLAFLVGSWLVAPLENAISRGFEREADAMALRLTQAPEVFKNAEIRLVRDNLINVAPTPWNVWFFSTHPTPVERIRFAERWR